MIVRAKGTFWIEYHSTEQMCCVYCLIPYRYVDLKRDLNIVMAAVAQLESDFEESGEFFDRTALLLCHLSLGLFMSFFVFDIVGDTTGWISGLIAAIVVFITIEIVSISLLYRKEIMKMWLSLFV